MLLLLLLKPKSPKWKFPTSNKRSRDSIAAINLIIMIPIGGVYMGGGVKSLNFCSQNIGFTDLVVACSLFSVGIPRKG